MTTTHRSWLAGAFLAAAMFVPAPAFAASATVSQGEANTAQYRQWIAQMKQDPRGPFAAIRWFCKDGRVLQPSDYSCAGKSQGW